MIYLKANVEGTTKLLELAVKHNIEHFVYASSSSVYGGLKKTLFSETDVVDSPVSQYAATKKMCELLAHTYYHLYGLNSTGLRFFTVYGPSGRPDMAAYKFIDRIANGRSIDQYGDGSSERDWTYVGDIVDGILRALDRPMGCEVFNLGNGNPIRLSSFIEEVQRQVGRRATIRVLPEQPGDVPRTAADVSKAKRLLGYSPKVGLVEGLRRTVSWYMEARRGSRERLESIELAV
jgi:UDP-glucuronate 4-epimerase